MWIGLQVPALIHYANRASTTTCGLVASTVEAVGRQDMTREELRAVTCSTCRAGLGLPTNRSPA